MTRMKTYRWTQTGEPESAALRTAGAGKDAHGGKQVMILRIVLIAAAIALIILGICNGSANDVFVKAINICTECIGLG